MKTKTKILEAGTVLCMAPYNEHRKGEQLPFSLAEGARKSKVFLVSNKPVRNNIFSAHFMIVSSTPKNAGNELRDKIVSMLADGDSTIHTVNQLMSFINENYVPKPRKIVAVRSKKRQMKISTSRGLPTSRR